MKSKTLVVGIIIVTVATVLFGIVIYNKQYKNIVIDSNNTFPTGDISVCDSMPDENYGTNAKDICYSDTAKILNDSSLCGKIKSEDTRMSCIAVIKKDFSICNELVKLEDKEINQGYKEWCYTDVAQAEKSLSICDKIQNEEIKRHCYGNVGSATGDISICDSITERFPGTDAEQNAKDGCYSDVAATERNPSICEKIGYEDARVYCYQNVAVITLDPSICDKTQDSSCYLSVAQAKQDASVCDKIQNKETSNACRDEVNSPDN